MTARIVNIMTARTGRGSGLPYHNHQGIAEEHRPTERKAEWGSGLCAGDDATGIAVRGALG